MEEKNSEQILIDDSSNIRQIINQIKFMIFDIVTLLLKEDPISFFWRVIMLSICTVQVSSFAFDYQMIDLWKNPGFMDILSQVFRYFRIVPLLEKGNFQLFQVFFYLMIFLLVLLIFLLLYIGITMKKKSTPVAWAVDYVRLFTEALQTFAYIPLVELFLIVFKCEAKGDLIYHKVWKDEQCYTGTYITYTFLGSAMVVAIFLYVGLMTSIFYECRLTTQDCYSRTTGSGDMLFHLFKTALCVSFLVFNQDLQIVLLFVFIAFSIVLFDHFSFNLYYHHYYISKLISSQMAIFMWTSLMLLLGKIMQSYSFDGTPFVYVIGLPFIIVIIMLRQEQNFDIILINSNNYEVLSQPLNQLQYLTKLVNLYHLHKGIAILIDGFLDYHRCLTSKEDSHVKRRVLKTTKFCKILREQGECEQVIMVIAVMQGMYYYGLQKFPNNTRLRILYALYLLDKMHGKQQALQELLYAELESPTFSEQFIIYRYKLIIENTLMEPSSDKQSNAKKNDNFEMMNELSVQNHMKQCRTNIERSASLYLEFWSQLSEETPDLGKLSEIGYKINIINQFVDEQWNKLRQSGSYIPSIMRLYAKFLIQILNDKEGGEEILLKLGEINNNKNLQNKGNSTLIDINCESKPTIFISAEEDSFGMISNINLAASGQLGYNKTDIVNRNVKVLMPNLYSKYHDNFIDNYLSTLEPRILNTEKQFPGKNKLDYIVPLYMIIRQASSLIHGLQFMSQFRVQKSVNLICYLIIDSEGKIQNTSSSVISVLAVDQKRILKRKMVITDCIQDFYERIKEIQQKNGINTIATDLGKKKRQFIVNLQASEISFRTVGFQGYYLKIEKLKSVQSNIQDQKEQSPNKTSDPLQTVNPLSYRTNQKSVNKNFQVKFDPYSKTFMGNIYDGPPGLLHDEVDQTIMILDSANYKIPEEIIDNRTQQEKDDEAEANRPKYGLGIKTLRLYQGKILDVEDIKREEGADEEEEQNEDEQNKAKEGKQEEESEENGEVGNIFKNRQNFLKFTQSETFLYSKAMKSLRIISTLFIFICIGLCFLNHFISESELSQCKDRYNLLAYNNKLISSSQRIISKLFELYFIKKDLLGDQTTKQKDELINEQKKDIEDELKKMQDLQNFIQLNTFDMTPEHQLIFNTDSVQMKFREENMEKTRFFDINESTQQLISKINFIKTQQIDQFDTDKDDFFFLQYNILNYYYMSQRKVSDYYVIELKQWSHDKNSVFLNLLIISVSYIVFSIMFILPFFLCVNQSSKEVLTIFLDIPARKAKKLFMKSENFVNQMQSGNDEEIFSDTSLQSKGNNDDDMLLRGSGKKRKKYKIDLKNKSNFFFPFLLSCIILEVYFGLTYYFSITVSNSIKAFIDEANITAMIESYFSYTNNAQRQMLIDPEFPIYGTTPIEYLKGAINEMYILNSNMQKEHSKNLNNHHSSYVSAYQNVMMNNKTCEILTDKKLVSLETCQKFAQGTILQGISICLPRHIENFRFVITKYEKILVNGKKDKKYLQENTKEIIKLPVIGEISEMQESYVRNVFQYIFDVFIEGLQLMLDQSTQNRVLLLIIAILVQIFFYLFLWLPILSAMTIEVIRIRSMVTMIPLEISQKTRSIRNLILSHAK